MVSVQCPSCSTILEIERRDLGAKTECSKCYAIFFAESYDPNKPDTTRAKAPLHHARDRFDADDNRNAERRQMLYSVTTKANSLRWTAIAGMVLMPIIGVLYLVFALKMGPVKAGQPNVPEMLAITGLWVMALGFAYFLGLFVSAIIASRGNSSTWAYIAAALGVASAFVFGPCIPVTWAGVVFGIQLFIALRDPRVSAAYRGEEYE